MNKHHLSEDDINVKFITPALIQSGWDETTQIRRSPKGASLCAANWSAEAKPKRPTLCCISSTTPSP
jgi:type I restriction enzyme R subunit